MSSLTTFVSCPDVQERLDNIYETGGIRTEYLPLSSYIFSEANNYRKLQMQAIPSAGKKRTVVLTFERRVLESEVDAGDFTCSATNKRGETSTTIDLDTTPRVRLAKAFELNDLIERCEQDADYYARLVFSLIDGCDRKVETLLASELVAFAGAFSTKDRDQDGTNIGSNTKTISTRKSDKSLDYFAHAALMQTARMNGYVGAPIIAGDYEIKNYYDAINKGCCAADGINFAEVSMETPIILPSFRIADALTDVNKFITFQAGVILPVWFNRYLSDFWQSNDSIDKAGVIVSPSTGIPYDYRVKRDCDDVSVEVGLAWDVFALPDDMFENSDYMDGNRLVHKHVITNP